MTILKYFRICPGIFLLLSVIILSDLSAQTWRQTQTDDYTRYELLEPGSQKFRIFYDVSATTPGAEYYFNGLRAGSEHEVTAVYDLMTGAELEWKIVDGEAARATGMANARANGEYLQIKLARPVPEGGEARIRIDKTYADPESYLTEGETVTFTRSLGIKRNSVVLPAGYELTGVNYPSQIMTEPDGRIKVSFMNPGPGPVNYTVRGRKLTGTPVQPASTEKPDLTDATSAQTRPVAARIDYTFTERSFQDREIVYFLLAPESHSFRLYHDYTETREGVDRYLNVVRAGSKASKPSAYILDTGEKLKVETLKGHEITDRNIGVRNVTEDTEVVVIWFAPVKQGHSVRLRIEETYTDPNRYLLYGDTLVWDRSFGRPVNTVVLPAGWYVTTSSIPAVVSQTQEGSIQLKYVNDRQGNIDVFIKAKRR